MALRNLLDDLREPLDPRKVEIGIVTGYVYPAIFGVLAVLVVRNGLLDDIRWPILLIGSKLISNAAMHAALRSRRTLRPWATLNTLVDVPMVIGAIYLTGGQVSPLFPIIVIELTVLALLTNPGTTLVATAVFYLAYAAMAVLVGAGVLPGMPAPVSLAGGLTKTYSQIDLLYASIVLALTMILTTRISALVFQNERALRVRTEELVDAERQRSQFMANITHELRTPIMAISGRAELLEENIYGELSPRQREAIRGIIGHASDLAEVVDDLLTLAKSDAGKLPATIASQEISDLMQRVAGGIAPVVERKGLNFLYTVDDALPAVDTDGRKVTQIVLNFLTNAIKYTDRGGWIRLSSARSKEGGVMISVEDNGRGIPEELLGKIFDDFFQIDHPLKRDAGGVGLGLPLARRLARMIGAEIKVVSQVAKGSTFTLLLPPGK